MSLAVFQGNYLLIPRCVCTCICVVCVHAFLWCGCVGVCVSVYTCAWARMCKRKGKAEHKHIHTHPYTSRDTKNRRGNYFSCTSMILYNSETQKALKTESFVVRLSQIQLSAKYPLNNVMLFKICYSIYCENPYVLL